MSGPAWLSSDEALPDPHGRGARAVAFVEKLRLHEGALAGQPFPLARWQRRIIERVYGDTDADGRRRVRTVFILLPRGNGKTTLSAALAGLHLFGPEREGGGQVIAAASDREQASIAFNATAGMIAQDAYLTSITDPAVSQKVIKHPASRSTYKAVSHEAYSKHGLSISFLIADEVHAWPKRELWDVLTGSMGKRAEPLTFVITTAGRGSTGLAFDLYTYAKKVAEGKVKDETFLPILFEPEPGFDWQDEAVWHAVNPALADGFRSLEEMRVWARQAREIPAKLAAFRQYYLNAWDSGAAAPWLDMAVYDDGGDPINLAELEGQPAWIGVDLSSVEDLTAVVAVVARPEGGYAVVPRFFIPRETIARRSDQVPYREWVEAGHITATEGAVVDYEEVHDAIYEMASTFDVQEVVLDRWNSTATQAQLTGRGLPVVTFGQGFASMSPAVKETTRLILARELQHGGHPVLRWCFENARVVRDDAGNEKLSKAKSAEKIDGAVAAAMGIGRAAANDNGPCVYDTDERPTGIIFL